MAALMDVHSAVLMVERWVGRLADPTAALSEICWAASRVLPTVECWVVLWAAQTVEMMAVLWAVWKAALRDVRWVAWTAEAWAARMADKKVDLWDWSVHLRVDTLVTSKVVCLVVKTVAC
jgi:hypothetical protein